MRMERVGAADAGMLLVRMLRTMAAAAGIVVSVESIGGRPWASATFAGTRHRVVLTGEDIPAFRSWLDGLAEAAFALRGHLVADLNVDAVEDGRATVTVLTLEEA